MNAKDKARKPPPQAERADAAKPGQPGHDEWLLDEAIEETFPASDAPAATQPGSTVADHYSSARRNTHK
jgi:hypothetical protein